MSNINVLSKEMAELIAAGEIIERPSSIIKELLENAIDSGANIITVEIKHGGITYMRVSDNGLGIAKDEISTAFLRHATSKISSKDDLDNILTLGFRGEALASIAAISKVEVISKQTSEYYGTRYVIEGSDEKLSEQCGCSNGTSIIIRDIFYNIPARLKFLKKDVTEGNAISAIVNKIALSHPDISIKLIRDNKSELFTPGDGQLFSTVYAVFGREFAQSLLELDYDVGNSVKISGYTIKPIYAKANRAFQNFFINNRYIKSITCMVALEEAYKSSVLVGKFPACVLNISIPPNIVDVNVHPAKIEVRFSDEKLIFDSVFFAVKNALLTDKSSTELDIKQLVKPIILHETDSDLDVFSIKQTVMDDSSSTKDIVTIHESKPTTSFIDELTKSTLNMDEYKYITPISMKKSTVVEKEINVKNISIKFIGEVFLNYILAEVLEDESNAASLLLIDKHAAHERYIFEQLKNNQSELNSQMLLEQVEVMLSYEEFSALECNTCAIEKMGFIIDIGTASSVIVKGMPSVLSDASPIDVITEIAVNLLNYKNNPTSDLLDELYHSIACRTAIKANDKNNMEELKTLIEKIYNEVNIRYCPHGRPVMIKLTKKELEKQFKRLG